MRFWDASAIVPLLVFEASSRALQALAKQDPTMLVWWGSEVECASAVARIERDGALDPRNAGQAFDRLRQLSCVWHEVEPSDPIRQIAVRFLRRRSAASRRCATARRRANAAAEHRPTSLDVVTLDERLAVAASKEGFPVLDTQSCRPVDREASLALPPHPTWSAKSLCPSCSNLRSILLGRGDDHC